MKGFHGRNRFALLVWTAAAVLVLDGCSESITTVPVARVEVSPATTSVQVGQNRALTARALASGGEPLMGRPVEWRSLHPDIAEVDGNGNVSGVAVGSATIEASSDGVKGSATVNVTTGPIIVLSSTAVDFTAVRNGATPGDRAVTVENGGTGTLNGLATQVRYTAGEPTGWLSAALSSTAPATLVLSASQAGLVPGVYTASVDVSSAAAANSPVVVTVRLTVADTPPAIALGATSVTFVAAAGAPEPAAQSVAVTNAGGGTLNGLATAISYTAGQPGGWLTATLSTTSAPASIALRPATAGLAPGTYSAIVSVTSSSAQNSPQQIAVTLTIGAAQPAIGVSSTSLTFTAPQNGPNTATQAVQITNAGGGALTGLGLSVTFPGGQPTGWLSATLSATTAPATVTLGAVPGSLAPGSYTGTVSITSPVAINSPRQIAVTFTVQEPTPAIVVTPPSVTFTTASTSGDPAPVQLAISNGGGGTLSGLSTSVSYAAGGATGWLTAQLAGTMAPTTLTLNAARGSLAVGTHTATVRITSAQAPARDVPVTFTIAAAAPLAPSNVLAAATAHDRIEVRWTDRSGDEDRFEVGRSPDGGSTWPITFNAAAGAELFVDQGLPGSTAYTYRVRACNAIGCSAWSGTASATTAPVPPSGLTANAASASRIDLSWTNQGTGATDIELERSADGLNWSPRTTLPASATSFSDTQVSPGSSYHYRLRACRSGVCSGPGGTAQATTPVVPVAPGGLSAVAVSATQVNVSWSHSGTAAEFRIESRTGSGSFAQVGTVPGTQTSFTHAGVAPAATHHYRVRACSATDCSPYSAEASATTPLLAPGAPASLQASAAGTTSIALTWTASSGTVAAYHLERATASGGPFTEIATVASTATTHTDTGLSSGATYFYRVRARNDTAYSGYSPVASATTGMLPPGTPGSLTATAISHSRVDLSWSASSGAVAWYRISRRTGADGAWAVIDSVAGGTHSYGDESVAAATSYTYRVVACNAGGCSAASNDAGVTTPPSAVPGAPASLTAVVSGTSIGLSWSAASGVVTEYRIERSVGNADTFAQIAVVDGTLTSYSDQGLNAGTTYFYRVRAANALGTSGYSPIASAATLDGPPAVPGNVTVSLASPSQVRVSWSAVPGATHYDVRRMASSGGWVIVAEDIPAGTTQYTDTPGTAGTYRYSVRACAGSNCSNWSSPSQSLPVTSGE